MFAKIALLVLLGAVAVLAAPDADYRKVEVQHHQTQLSELEERGIEETWAKLKQKFSRAIEIIKATWQKIKERGQKIYNVNLMPIKEKGMELLQMAKETYKKIVADGEDAEPDVKEIQKNLKELVNDLKQTGAEAYDNAKELVHEVVETVKEKLNRHRVDHIAA